MAAGYSSQSGSSGLGVTTGVVTIGAGTCNRLTTAVGNLQPGDAIYRPIDLVSTTTLLSSVTLSTTDTYGGAKLSTATVGLQMTVQWCPTVAGWTEAGSAPAVHVHLPRRRHHAVASRDVITSSPLSLGSGLNARELGVHPADNRSPADHPDPSDVLAELGPGRPVRHQLHVHRGAADTAEEGPLTANRLVTACVGVSGCSPWSASGCSGFLGIGPRTGLYRTVTVLSGSMRPHIPAGAVLVETPMPGRDPRVGQVVTYAIPVDDHRIVTHRVVGIVSGGRSPGVRDEG